ncbi:MAG TPA: transcriptional regulator [Deltaproteobacteria bacterium]|nr:transcriptional regulator [Deltaproteobacteria bacterium]
MNKLNIGIASYEEMKQWTLDVAAGRIKPDPSGPKLWFTSLKAAANLFTEENRQLLKVIAEQHPQSIAELEKLTHRKASNLSRTLKKLEQYGLVRLVEAEEGRTRGKRPVRPELLVDSVNVSLSLL